MPWMGFEPTIPASERAKTVHVLDRSATVTGVVTNSSRGNYMNRNRRILRQTSIS
jgi:hypothetical protein